MITKEELRKLDKETLVDMVYDLLLKVDELTSQVRSLSARVRELEEENRRLKTPKNSRNSSLPPSSDIFDTRNRSLRRASGKKPGGQPGHKGETLSMSEHPDKIIDHPVGENCSRCGEVLPPNSSTPAGRRQVIDVPPIRAEVIEHRIYTSQCRCGCVNTSTFPFGVNAPVQYGDNLTSLVAYMSSRQYVPYCRLSELISSMTNLSISEGTISNMLNRVTNSVLPIYRGIKEEVSKATTVGGDETGLKVGKKKYWAWTWQTPFGTYIVVSDNRGFITIEKTFPEGFRFAQIALVRQTRKQVWSLRSLTRDFPHATYVSDSLGTQLKTPAKRHQLCIAHILRELNYFRDAHKARWADDMKDLLERAIRLKSVMLPGQYASPLEERSGILREFDILINQSLPDGIPKMLALQKRLKKRKDSVFNFLFHYDVPYENNASERAVRNVKVKQKVSGSFRSERGAEIFAILRSVVDTTIKKGGKPFETIRFALSIATGKNEFLTNKHLRGHPIPAT